MAMMASHSVIVPTAVPMERVRGLQHPGALLPQCCDGLAFMELKAIVVCVRLERKLGPTESTLTLCFHLRELAQSRSAAGRGSGHLRAGELQRVSCSIGAANDYSASPMPVTARDFFKPETVIVRG